MVFEAGDSLLWQLDTGKSGVATSFASHGVSVFFDTATAPPAQTLVDASVMLHCNPEAARKSHIMMHWEVDRQNHPAYLTYGWAHCLQNGTVRASIHAAVPYRVTAVNLQVHPEAVLDIGPAVFESHASLRRDLKAERDLSQQARHVLEFKKNKRQVGPVVP